MKDYLGERIKSQYEDRTRYKLPRRTYTIIRLDGKSFHGLTRNLKRPFDDSFISLMDLTAAYLCQEIQNCKFSYIQSDEISLLLRDFDDVKTDQWFDGNIQKMASISASMATYEFNRASNLQEPGLFDARVFTIPDAIEVENYFIWRQKDATRNSIQMVAQSLYSHHELEGIKLESLQEMIFQKGINWNDYDAGKKRGRMYVKRDFGWEYNSAPIFTTDREFLRKIIQNEQVQ